MCLEDNCGLFGECVNNSCFCEVGWTQNTELTFKCDEVDQEKCGKNTALIRALFSIQLAVHLLGLFMILPFSKRRSQVIRNLGVLVGTSAGIAAAILKLIDPNRDLADDFAFTFFLAVGAATAGPNTSIFLYRFVKHHRSTLLGKDSDAKLRKKLGNLAAISLYTVNFLNILAFSSLILSWNFAHDAKSESNCEQDMMIAESLWRTFQALNAFQSLVLALCGNFLLSSMQRCIFDLSVRSPKSQQKVAKNLGKMKRITVGMSFIQAAVATIFASINSGFHVYVLLYPVLSTATIISIAIVLNLIVENRKIAKKIVETSFNASAVNIQKSVSMMKLSNNRTTGISELERSDHDE